MSSKDAEEQTTIIFITILYLPVNLCFETKIVKFNFSIKLFHWIIDIFLNMAYKFPIIRLQIQYPFLSSELRSSATVVS